MFPLEKQSCQGEASTDVYLDAASLVVMLVPKVKWVFLLGDSLRMTLKKFLFVLCNLVTMKVLWLVVPQIFRPSLPHSAVWCSRSPLFGSRCSLPKGRYQICAPRFH